MTHGLLAGAWRALDDAGLRWLVLRWSRDEPVAEGDVDLVVDPSSLDDARAVLEALGYVRAPHGDPAELHLVAHDPDRLEFCWLHVRGAVGTRRGSLSGSTLLAASRRSDSVPVPDPGMDVWALVLDHLVAKGEVPERHRSRLVRDVDAARAVVDRVRGALRANGVDPAAVLAAVESRDWPGLDRLAADVPGPPAVERVRGRLVQVRRRRRRRGLSVAVIGPDGAGKTSLVAALDRTLPVPTRRLYMGLTGGRIPVAERLRVPGLVFLARQLLLWARAGVDALERERGVTVLHDRSPLDALVPSGRRSGPAGRFGRRLAGRLLPRADIVLVLDAPGEVLHRRSGEYDATTLESWRQAYLRVGSQVGAAVLDATRPADEVLADAQAHVWEHVVRRWGAVPRGSARRQA